jgi:hypothetical protein
MINIKRMRFATAKVLAVCSANNGDNMILDKFTCRGERQ